MVAIQNGPLGSTSSHVNLGDITHYNNKAQRQRPQTGKIRSSQQASQGGGTLKITSFSKGNAHRQRRLTSAKGAGEQVKGLAPKGSGLSNTRDIINSFGHLTTTAGTNYDPQYRTSQQGQQPPPKPIVRQHFVMNGQKQRLRSAKPPMATQLSQNNLMLIANNAVQSSQSRFKQSKRPKSGVPTHRPSVTQHHQRRIQSGKMSSVHRERQVSVPYQTQYLRDDQNQISENAQEIDISQLMITEHDQNVVLTATEMAFPTTTKSAVKESKRRTNFKSQTQRPNYQNRHHRQLSTKYNLTKTIYKLPSLSQCIENQILPRNSEYMRRLYSIAMRNHENQVPKMISINRRSNQDGGNQRVSLTIDAQMGMLKQSPDLCIDLVQNPNSNDTSPKTLAKKNASVPATTTNLTQSKKAKDIDANPIRSQSFVTLNVKNLQFPFDNSCHGGFNQVKQRDLNLSKNPFPQSTTTSLTGIVSPKRRPYTAGRIRKTEIPSIDLFNNQKITEATNQVSTNALGTAQNNLPDGIKLADHQLTTSPGDQYQQEVLMQDNPINPALLGNSLTINSSNDQQITGGAQIVIGLKPQKPILPQDGDSLDAAKIASDIAIQSPLSNFIADKNEKEDTLQQLLFQKNDHSSSRRHSFHESPHKIDPVLNSFFKKSQGVDNSQSQRDFVPMHFQERNGTQLVVQMSGQGLTTKRLNSNDSMTNSQTSRSGGRRKKKVGKQQRQSSTHSLQINVKTATNKQESDQNSLNDTNKLEDSEYICMDDRGVKIMERSNSKDFDDDNSVSKLSRRSQDFNHRGSRSSFMSNKDLDHVADKVRPKRQSYPIRPLTAKQRKPSNQADDSHISLQSQSQNMTEQMRLKNVYDNNQTQSGQRVIHRIPVTGRHGEHHFVQMGSQGDSLKQLLVVTNDPRQFANIQEGGSISNMSNPLNHVQMSVDKMKPIKIKSIVFDKNNASQIREVDRGHSILEQTTVISDQYVSPGRDNKSYFSPIQSNNYELMDLDDSKLLLQQREDELAHAHKQFKVTMQVKRVAKTKDQDLRPTAPQPAKEVQATLKGRKMRLQSADQRKVNKQHQSQKLERNLHVIDMVPSSCHEEDDQSTPNLGLKENSKATVHNVPLLALPNSDTATQFIVDQSQIPSSHRQNLSHSQSSITKPPKRHTPLRHDSNQILNSFNNNNVRTNLRGDLAKRLIQGIDLNDSTPQDDTMNNHLRISAQSMSSPVRPKPINKFFQPILVHQPDKVKDSVAGLIATHEEDQSPDMVGSSRDFATTLPKDHMTKSYHSSNDDRSSKSIRVEAEDLNERGPEMMKPIELSINEVSYKEDRPATGEAVIQEQEEGGSSDGGTQLSMGQQTLSQKHLTQISPETQVEQLKISEKHDPLLIAPSSVTAKNSNSRNIFDNVGVGSSIRSVYEAEAQALKKGIIKAYSGKNETGKRQRHNTDLQHFLQKERRTSNGNEDPSMRTSFNKRSDLSNYKTQPKRNSVSNNDHKQREDKTKSQFERRTSSINLPITNIQTMVQRKPIEERPKSFSPSEVPPKAAIHNLEAHQKQQSEAIMKAQELMKQAKLMKLDPTVVNQQLIDLFKYKKDTEELTVMMNQAKHELGTQTLLQTKGLDIPFHIATMRHQVRTREKDGASIMTKKLSSSSLNKPDNLTKFPSFAPQSPPSIISTVRHNNDLISSKAGFAAFAINSVGGSTNRFSKAELPQFGGIISSRIGELINSQNDLQGNYLSSGEALELPWSGSKVQRAAAPIIDYSQNFIQPTTTKINKGVVSMIPSSTVRSPTSDQKQPTLKPKKSARKQRPTTAGRYRKDAPQGDFSRPPALLTSADQTAHVVPTVMFEQQDEHQMQPEWAVRRNLKSKFNMTSQEHQSKQVQKFFIDTRNNDDNITPDRNLTQLIVTQQVSSKLRQSYNMSDATANAEFIKRSAIMEHRAESEAQDSPMLKKRVCSMPIDSNSRDRTAINAAAGFTEVSRYQPNVDDEYQNEKKSSASSVDEPLDVTSVSKRSSAARITPLVTDQPDQSPQGPKELLSVNTTIQQPRPVQVHNQSMQCSLMTATPRLDQPTGSSVHAQEFHVTASDPNLIHSHTSSQQPLNPNYDLKSSTKSLVNSRKVLEKAQGGKYVGRSQAGNSHFSLTNMLVNSSRSLHKSTK